MEWNMIECPHCGKPKRVIAAFCPHCGKYDGLEETES